VGFSALGAPLTVSLSCQPLFRLCQCFIVDSGTMKRWGSVVWATLFLKGRERATISRGLLYAQRHPSRAARHANR
jgi:hypothetical protein